MEQVVQLKEISKVYSLGKVDVHALRSISLEITENEYAAIMGPSGSGKSTLMNILGCLDTPTSGQYWFNGTDVGQLTDNELAAIRNQQVGFTFQMFNLLPRLNALENVALPMIYAGIGKEQRNQRAQEMLELVGLGDRMNHHPNELSGGQQQRVAIARALVNNPSMILADEPTGNLDSESSQDIMELFNKVHGEGNTVILVTHEHHIAQYANRVITLQDGKVASDETNKKVKEAQQ